MILRSENLVKKYGEEDGERRWENYKRLQSETNTFDYKKQKYGWNKKKFDEYNRSRAVTLENLTRKYGPEEGKRIFDGYVEKQRTNGNSLKWFIEKHGEEKGKEIFYRVLDGKLKGFLNPSSKAYSRISQDFFSKIDKSLSKKFTTYYQNKNKEYRIIIDENKYHKVFYLDYYIEEIKVCIEFFGDYYHANPNKFKDPEQILKFRTEIKVRDIRERDQLRIETLEKYLGIKTIIVWELDFNKNKNNPDFYKNIIKLCTERI
jgi:G:T-mismatch repair DNA endonuclease (very short patch repair protein)